MEFTFKITEWHYDITRLNNQDSEIIICCVVFNDPAKYSSALNDRYCRASILYDPSFNLAATK